MGKLQIVQLFSIDNIVAQQLGVELLIYRNKIANITTKEAATPLSSTHPIRVIIHGHHPKENLAADYTGKLIHLPDSVEDLFQLAERKFGKKGNTILLEDGTKLEELNDLRENDQLFIFEI